MRLTQMQVLIGHDIRIELFLFSDGRILLCPGYGFTPLFDHKSGGVYGFFDAKGFSLIAQGEKEVQNYEYNVPYPYKTMPVLKEWLTQQNLQWPE